MNNKLILRTLNSPYDDTTKGSVLSHDDVIPTIGTFISHSGITN